MRARANTTCLAALVAILVTAAGCGTASGEADDATSATDEAYTASAMPAEVNRRVERCFTKDWSQEPLRVSNVKDIWGGDRYTVPGLTQIGEADLWVFNELGHLVLRGSSGEQVIHELVTSLAQIRDDQKLADFQQVEVVLCVTSRLITYADLGLKTFLGADEAVAHYEGVCREYAGLSARLMKAIDLDGHVVAGEVKESNGNGGHAWNDVTLASTSTTYWIEPQDDPMQASPAVFFDPQPH